jgi:hypothetical protein
VKLIRFKNIGKAKKNPNNVLKFLASANYKNPWVYFLGKQVGGFFIALKRREKKKERKKQRVAFFGLCKEKSQSKVCLIRLYRTS